MTKCVFASCPNAATRPVRIDLGERWDDHTLIAPEARIQQIDTCDEHAAVLAANLTSGFREIGASNATTAF
jgi:hypothetical protein